MNAPTIPIREGDVALASAFGSLRYVRVLRVLKTRAICAWTLSDGRQRIGSIRFVQFRPGREMFTTTGRSCEASPPARAATIARERETRAADVARLADQLSAANRALLTLESFAGGGTEPVIGGPVERARRERNVIQYRWIGASHARDEWDRWFPRCAAEAHVFESHAAGSPCRLCGAEHAGD